MSRVLAVVAHPDDESLFCGATLASHVRHGDAVHVVSLGTGVGARGELGDELQRALERRTLAFVAATTALGASCELLRAYPDQEADTVPQITINRIVESVLERWSAYLVYTHWIGDLNVDHRRVAEAVWVATRMGPRVRCMSPEFPDRCVGPAWEPDASGMLLAPADLDAKWEACRQYGMELRAWPHPRSERAIRERAERFMEIR